MSLDMLTRTSRIVELAAGARVELERAAVRELQVEQKACDEHRGDPVLRAMRAEEPDMSASCADGWDDRGRTGG